jgi:anaphase-promoting complex subunit 4
VTINRFKFDMPIKIPAPDEKLEVRSLAWRMDEKILGIAYDNGLVSLIDVESKDEIHSLNVNGDISSICWTQNMINIDEQEKELMKTFQTYLAPLPALNMLSGNKKTDYNAEKFYSEDALNFLLVTTTDAKIHIYIYGILHCGFIDIAKDLNIEQSNIKLLEVKLSRSLKELYVIYKINSEIKLVVYDNQTLIKYNLSLWKLSVKYGTILNILGYIEDTIQQITEAWEIVLLEMDKKLTKYAKKQLPGSVSADFLELLMFGFKLYYNSKIGSETIT